MTTAAPAAAGEGPLSKKAAAANVPPLACRAGPSRTTGMRSGGPMLRTQRCKHAAAAAQKTMAHTAAEALSLMTQCASAGAGARRRRMF